MVYSVLVAGVSVLWVYAIFSVEPETTIEEIDTDLDEVSVHAYNGRKVVLSCQTCRKLKNHKEIEPYLFECMKCKRKVDMRVL